MQSKKIIGTVLAIFSISLAILACDLTALLPTGAARPSVAIQSPSDAANFKEGDEISVQSASTDPTGVVRVELLVDGQVVSTDAPPIPQGQTSFSLVQKWKATAGQHTLGVRAYNAGGTGSDPAVVSVTVAAGSLAQAPSTPGLSTSTVASPTPAPAGTQPTNTPNASSSQPTATRRPNTPTPIRPTATAVVNVAPGVYAISVRLDPPNPKASDQVTFFVTFLNTTGAVKHLTWYVRIFTPDKQNSSFGETAKKTEDIQVGRTEMATPNNWKYGPVTADCQPLFARAFWLDNDNNIPTTEFLKTDGQSVNTGFNVCP